MLPIPVDMVICAYMHEGEYTYLAEATDVAFCAQAMRHMPASPLQAKCEASEMARLLSNKDILLELQLCFAPEEM